MAEPSAAYPLRDMARGWVEKEGLRHFSPGALDDARRMHVGWSEILLDTETAHRVLDWFKVPGGHPQGGGDIDTRVDVLVSRTMRAESSLSAIASAHVREAGPAGMVGDYCIECDRGWPCPTNLWATGQRDSLACWDPADDEPEAQAARPEPEARGG